MHQLKRLEQLDLVDLEVGIGARHRDRGAEALDLLAGDADHRLAGDGVAHVLRLGHRLIAAVDDPLDIGWDPALHVGKFLPLSRGPQHDAVTPLPLDDQRLDVLGADVQGGVVVLVVGASPQALDPVFDLDHPGLSPFSLAGEGRGGGFNRCRI